MFSLVRERASDDHLKASASEMLQVYPLVREFARSIVEPAGTMESECASLFALCDVLDAMMAVKQARRHQPTWGGNVRGVQHPSM